MQQRAPASSAPCSATSICELADIVSALQFLSLMGKSVTGHALKQSIHHALPCGDLGKEGQSLYKFMLHLAAGACQVNDIAATSARPACVQAARAAGAHAVEGRARIVG